MRSWIGFAVFFGVASLILGGLHYYLWRRFVFDLELMPPWRNLATAAIVFLFVLILTSLPLYRILPRETQTPLMAFAMSWLGFLFILFIVLVGRDAALWVAGLTIGEFDPARRAFLTQSATMTAGVVASGLASLGMYKALRTLEIKPVKVRLARLPASMRGFRLVQISDIHVGPTIGREFVAEITARINQLDPDLVAITGDLVDGTVEELAAHVEPLREIRARHGVYFVPGNHEYYSGLHAWLQHLESLGIRVLRNQRASIGGEGADGFDLVGLDDETGRPDIEKAIQGRNPEREMIVLAHQPRTIRYSARHGAGLQISGHTHGGQIWPWNYLVLLQQPYIVGLHRHHDTYIYVSPGTGYWGPPMRLGSRAQITLIELV